MTGRLSPSQAFFGTSSPMSLSALEPYAVAVTVVTGWAPIGGMLEGAAPTLVALCWFLFLLVDWPSGTCPRRTLSALGQMGPSLGCAAIGWAVLLAPGLPLGVGWREAVLATVGAGLAYWLLPGRSHTPLPPTGGRSALCEGATVERYP